MRTSFLRILLLGLGVQFVEADLKRPLPFATPVPSRSLSQDNLFHNAESSLTSTASATELPDSSDLRTKDVLSLTLSPAMYLGSVWGACNSSFASSAWIMYLVAALFSAVMFSSQTYKMVRNTLRHDIIDEKDYVAIFAAHLFSATALPLSVAMLWSRPSRHDSSRLFLILSAVVQSIGSGAEVLAHYRDGWVYGFGGHAEYGVENIVFTFSLVGAFCLLAISFSPSIKSIAMNALLLLLLLPCIGRWEKCKKNVFAAQFLASVSLAASMFQETRSPWPMLIFAQAFNMIRASFRIKKTKIQKLHLCPSIYGWISYVLTFGLYQNYDTVSAPVALAVTAMTIYLTDMLEKMISSVGTEPL